MISSSVMFLIDCLRCGRGHSIPQCPGTKRNEVKGITTAGTDRGEMNIQKNCQAFLRLVLGFFPFRVNLPRKTLLGLGFFAVT